MNMNLTKLIDHLDYELLQGDIDREIQGVAYHSGKVTPGSLFCCLVGAASDGHKYAADVAAAGACVLLVERDGDYPQGCTVLKVTNTRRALALVAAAWFSYPAEKLTVIALTGTKGKTTVAHMVKAILEAAGHKTGMIGTLGAMIGDEKVPTGNTTPESFELHSLFARMVSEGCSHVVLEASSQGFKMDRTYGIAFDYGVFLNLSPDHISANEHKDYEEYRYYKSRIFSQTRTGIVNLDSEEWEYVTKEYKGPLCTFSLDKKADYRAALREPLWETGFLGSRFRIDGIEAEFLLNMPGDFNIQNALAAIAIADREGIPVSCMQEALKAISVKGRTQLLYDAAHFTTMIIDYAHNALSTESLLSMLKAYKPKRLICLFGGGGNKPKMRRFDMGNAAGKYADLSVLTMDNPRFEKVEDINLDIIEGLNQHDGKYMTIIDREEAIHYLIDHSLPGDIIALIGKGHEEYQEVQGVKYHFSEEEIVREYLAGK